ncbi:hypothetical protein GCM10009663_07050 [Kitasatospora arboriphila]|uniref:Tetracyclin repressor-like C-terminal domain-containing protein n=1 Tax=Kitasatospora arboriphila TaxID=258052 RepID=A0ABN1TA63_9ACTN
MSGQQQRAGGGAQPVGGHHQVGLALGAAGRDPGGPAGVAGDARRLVRWCEGVVFHTAAGAGRALGVPGPQELRAEAARYLDALLAS